MERFILFDGKSKHGDKEYLEWLRLNPNGFVANIPKSADCIR
jgi:hypothetical protein